LVYSIFNLAITKLHPRVGKSPRRGSTWVRKWEGKLEPKGMLHSISIPDLGG